MTAASHSAHVRARNDLVPRQRTKRRLSKQQREAVSFFLLSYAAAFIVLYGFIV
jgi:hypothetical protein